MVLHMPSVSDTATLARSASPEDLWRMGGDLVHSSAGLVLLLIILVLNVYKPHGVTPYGWRAQHDRTRSG